MRTLSILVIVIVIGVVGALHAAEPGSDANTVVPTAVIAGADAKTEHFDWGTLITYFSDETYGTRDALAAVAIIKPGMEIHPPHEHAEEEYLMVLEGHGEWHLAGRDFAAGPGDMLYARPWDLHGIRNTGNKTLKFVVWKWNSKGLPVPQQPAAH